MNDQAAAAGPFANAARLLENLAWVHLTAKRVERAAEASGTAAAAALRDRVRAITDHKLIPSVTGIPPATWPRSSPRTCSASWLFTLSVTRASCGASVSWKASTNRERLNSSHETLTK